MGIMNHYLACFWFFLFMSLQSDHNYVCAGTSDCTWTEVAFGGDRNVPIMYAYSTALHWSLTQFTPASMEVTPKNAYERFFNIVVIVMALVIFSSFVSSITQAMT